MFLQLFCESRAAKMQNQLVKGIRFCFSLLFLFLLFLQSFLSINYNRNHTKSICEYSGIRVQPAFQTED